MNEWDYAKTMLDRMQEPSNVQDARYFDAGSHTSRGDTHSLVQYKLPIKIASFDGSLDWSVCKTCQKVQHKIVVLFNNESNLAYRRTIIKNGELVKNQYE